MAAIEIDDKPKNVCESRRFQQYDAGFPGGTMKDVVAWFAKQLEEIPSAYRDGAKCNFDTHREYDSVYVEIEISYIRPETADETTLRVERERSAMETKRNAELRELARLQSKYGAEEK